MSDELLYSVVQSRVVLPNSFLAAKQTIAAWKIDEYVSWVAPMLGAKHLPDLDFYIGVLRFKTEITDENLSALIHPEHRLPTRAEALAAILLAPSCINEYFREQPDGLIVMRVIPAPLFQDKECVNFVRKRGGTLHLTEGYVQHYPQWVAGCGHLVVEVPEDCR